MDKYYKVKVIVREGFAHNDGWLNPISGMIVMKHNEEFFQARSIRSVYNVLLTSEAETKKFTDIIKVKKKEPEIIKASLARIAQKKTKVNRRKGKGAKTK